MAAERGRWSWWIRIYVVTAVQCHFWAHYVAPFMKRWVIHCRVFVCAWDKEWASTLNSCFICVCVHSPVRSSPSSWRRSRCGWRWVWRTETLLSSSPLCCRCSHTLFTLFSMHLSTALAHISIAARRQIVDVRIKVIMWLMLPVICSNTLHTVVWEGGKPHYNQFCWKPAVGGANSPIRWQQTALICTSFKPFICPKTAQRQQIKWWNRNLIIFDQFNPVLQQLLLFCDALQFRAPNIACRTV